MTVIVLDADAVIRHGRSFSSRTRAAVDRDETIVLPNSVKQELVDDVLDGDPPDNHRRSAETIQGLIDDGVIEVTNPDFEKFSDVIDEARRRIANDSLPEHHVEADQYIPAVVCELANEQSVQFVTGDTKLQAVVRDISEAQGVSENVSIHEPLTVL